MVYGYIGPCRCQERKNELAALGIRPLLGGEKYTPLDYLPWLYQLVRAIIVKRRWTRGL